MKNVTTVTIKSEPVIDLSVEPEPETVIDPPIESVTMADPFSELKSLITAISIENDAGLLRAESSQAPFNSTRLLLTGRRELINAVMAYINGDPSKLQAMVRP